MNDEIERLKVTHAEETAELRSTIEHLEDQRDRLRTRLQNARDDVDRILRDLLREDG